MKSTGVSRRTFLGATAKVTAGITAVGGTAPFVSGQHEFDVCRWGIVGIGGRAQSHIEALNELDSCKIGALCDVRQDQLESGLARVQGPQPKSFRQYSEMLREADIDAVVIVTPNYLHKEMTIQALESGKHVLCEKPMGITISDCEEVIEVARKSDRVLQYGMQLRHTPLYIRVNEIVQGGVIGNLRYAWISDFRRDIRELYDDRFIERTQNWRYFQDTSGGMLLEYSIHRLDLINWWMNSKPTKISAFGGHNVWMDRETIDHAGLLVEYGNGARAVYGMSLFSRGFRAPWLLVGDAGQMLISGDSVTIQKGDVTNSIDSPRFKDTDEVIAIPSEEGTRIQYEHFLKAVRGEAHAYPDWKIAFNAMRVGILGEVAIREEKILDL